MTVSRREFFDDAYWKNKRYNTVIYQAGKNPADFEVVEQQDQANFEVQQAVNAIIQSGFVDNGFRADADSPASANTVRVKQGKGWIQKYSAENGTATGGTTSTVIEDATKAWIPNQWKGKKVYVQASTGAGKAVGIIEENDATTLTVTINTAPASTDLYTIVGDDEFAGIRLELPDVLTTFPSLTWEHAVDSNGYYVYDFTAEQTLAPPAGSYRYDLVYVEFWRKEYTPAEDPEMQDAVLGLTTHREKWYYEFHFFQGDNVNKNPGIPSLAANHYGVRLAIIRRDGTSIVSQDDLIDVRPKFSANQNILGSNFITVGERGGNYNNIYDVIDNRLDMEPIVPTADNPYTIFMLPGVHVCPYQLALGTMGYIKIQGAGVDKTILEFEDLYTLGITQWIDIGATPSIIFSDMTIRVNLTNADDTNLVGINGGTLRFVNCRIGEVNTTTLFGGISAVDSNINIESCWLESRSTTKALLALSGDTTAKVINSTLKQSGDFVIKDETVLAGNLRICSSEVIGNDQLAYLNGPTTMNGCVLTKEEWVAGDTTVASPAMHILSTPIRVYASQITGPSGETSIEVEDDCEFHGCFHDDEIVVDDVAKARFFSCNLRYVNSFNNATPEFLSCEFVATTSQNITLDSSDASFIGCDFDTDGNVITSTDSDFQAKGCRFATMQGIHVIELYGTCIAKILDCEFKLGFDGATCVGVYCNAITATAYLINSTFLGNDAGTLPWDALAVDSSVASTPAGIAYLSSRLSDYKGANINPISLENLQTGASVILPPGYINGLITSWASVTQVGIAVGSCRSDDDSTNLILTSPITIDITNPLGPNGLDIGTEASNAWYYIWLIYNPSTLEYAGLLSVSSTTPTMPAGFTKKRRVGSVRNDGTSNFVSFTVLKNQSSRRVIFTEPRQVYADTVLNGTITFACSDALPGTSLYPRILLNTATDDRAVQFRTTGSTNWRLGHGKGEKQPSIADGYILTDASQQLDIQSIGGNTNVTVSVIEYMEEL